MDSFPASGDSGPQVYSILTSQLNPCKGKERREEAHLFLKFFVLDAVT